MEQDNNGHGYKNWYDEFTLFLRTLADGGHLSLNTVSECSGYLHVARLCLDQPGISNALREILTKLGSTSNEVWNAHACRILALLEMEITVAPVLMEIINAKGDVQ